MKFLTSVNVGYRCISFIISCSTAFHKHLKFGRGKLLCDKCIFPTHCTKRLNEMNEWERLLH